MAVRTFVFDLDGVVYRGEQPLPGAVDTIETLRQRGHQVYFFTNNSSKTRAFYCSKLQRMGVQADPEHIMTSAYATALYLHEMGAHDARLLVIGEFGLKDELKAAGFRMVEDGIADYVVLGIDKEFNYRTLVKAQQAIRNGAKFIATNRDTTYPLENGQVVPGNGALVAAVEAATGVKPLVIGKPETPAMHEILELAGATPESTVVVGDRLDTDILAGKRIGAFTVLVLTGVTSEEEVAKAPPEMQPDAVVPNLPAMLEVISD